MLEKAQKVHFTLGDWVEFANGDPSLQSAEIIKIDRYVQKGIVNHRFLVFQLRCRGEAKDIFLRLDRRPKLGAGVFKLLSMSGETLANDCVGSPLPLPFSNH